MRIQPEEIEARLKRYPGVNGGMPIKACAAVPSATLPVELTAFIETAKAGEAAGGEAAGAAAGGEAAGEGTRAVALDLSAVRGFLLQELGRYYVPKHIVHLPNGLPRTASGKPDFPPLRQLAAEQEEGVGSAAADGGGAAEAEAVVAGRAPSAVLGAPTELMAEGGTRCTWSVDLRHPRWKFVHEHRYRGEPLFPGSGHVALAAEVAEATWPAAKRHTAERHAPEVRCRWELRALRFVKPLPLLPARALRVEAVASSAAAPLEALEITVSSVDDGELTLHCRCLGVCLGPPFPPPSPPHEQPTGTAPSGPSAAARVSRAEMSDEEYLWRTGIQQAVADGLNELLRARPHDPVVALADIIRAMPPPVPTPPTLPPPAPPTSVSAPPPAPPPATSATVAGSHPTPSVEVLYAELADCGFDYGPLFRSVESAERHESASGHARADGVLLRRRSSPFLLDPVDVDACFQLAPLVSSLGFEGAPTAIERIRRLARTPPSSSDASGCDAAFDDAAATERLSVRASSRRQHAEHPVGGGPDETVDFELSAVVGDPRVAADTASTTADTASAAAGVEPLWSIEGLALQSFETLPPEVAHVQIVRWSMPPPPAALVEASPPWYVVAVGAPARDDAERLAAALSGMGVVSGTTARVETAVATWQPGQPLQPAARRSSVALVVRDEAVDGMGVAAVARLLSLQLPALQFHLPPTGRVCLVFMSPYTKGEGADADRATAPPPEWSYAGLRWASDFPSLQLTILEAYSDVGHGARMLLNPSPPPYLFHAAAAEALSFALEPPPPTNAWSAASSTDAKSTLWLSSSPMSGWAASSARGRAAVLTLEVHPLSTALTDALLAADVDVTLVPSAEAARELTAAGSKFGSVVFCAIGSRGSAEEAAAFEGLCAAADDCLTIVSLGLLLPTPTLSASRQASRHASPPMPRAADAAFTACLRRYQAGHASRLVYAPPLMSGLWFEPPAPVGLHRCSVSRFVTALRGLTAGGPGTWAAVGAPVDALPKHWRHSRFCERLLATGAAERSPAELRAFLRDEVASATGAKAGTLSEQSGLDNLGLTSLASLRLSQVCTSLDSPDRARALRGLPGVRRLRLLRRLR